jgi:hypothetical protein
MNVTDNRATPGIEPQPTPRDSRWMIAYHLWAGVLLCSAARALFERQSIRLGALPAVLILAIGYIGSRP